MNDVPTRDERWLPVVDYEGSYEVSDIGRVRSLDRTVITKQGPMRFRGQILAQFFSRNGYACVVLSKVGEQTMRMVHQLMLESFVGRRAPGHEGRHLNDIRTDNRWPENLAWGTKKENFKDRLRNGKGNRGERHGNVVTTREVVAAVRARVAAGERQCDLAAEFDLTRANVWAIVHRQNWGWM